MAVAQAAELAAATVAEPQYSTAKTSVWWDIENCQVPRNCNANTIAKNISHALVQMNYCGPISILAYGDTNGIPSAIQHALSSTGITLNHVPAGIKDASDKKILVDMLLWAVDNPAPANYLLISGDRDFSNALHQLRLRRYNILLAQPAKSSAALFAAAKSVWLWTSLVNGGLPFTCDSTSAQQSKDVGAAPQNYNDNNQPSNVNSSSLALRVQPAPAKHTDDGKNVSRSEPPTPKKSMTRVASLPAKLEESEDVACSQKTERKPATQLMKLPHELYVKTPNDVASTSSAPLKVTENLDPSSSSSRNDLPEKSNNEAIRPRPYLPHQVMFQKFNTLLSIPSTSDGPKVSAASSVEQPAAGKLPVSNHLNFSQNDPGFVFRSGEVDKSSHTKPKSHTAEDRGSNKPSQLVSSVLVNDNNVGPFQYPRSASAPVAPNNVFRNGVRGSQVVQTPEYFQALIGVVLLALHTLKTEKLAPTESNITDCIRYGDQKQRNTDVRKALSCALDQEMIVKKRFGKMDFYIGRTENLWPCENPLGGKVGRYPRTIWDAIQVFLASSDGRAAIVASESRYEAALIFKKSCLKLQAFPLGEVLQILHIIIMKKQWIKHGHNGWRPVTITVPEALDEPW